MLPAAIITLFLSAIFGSYLAVAYTTSFQVATFAKATSMVLFVTGTVLLFIATDWGIGLVGIAGYWLLFTLSRAFWHKRLKSY